MEVVFSSAARADLIAIGDYIAQDNERRALTFVDQIEARCLRLSAFPHSHSLIAGHESAGIRRIVHGRYLIFYRIDDQAISVLRVLNGAMDYERILFPSDDDA